MFVSSYNQFATETSIEFTNPKKTTARRSLIIIDCIDRIWMSHSNELLSYSFSQPML